MITKKRLAIMTIIDLVFAFLFIVAAASALDNFELFFTITYFILALFSTVTMSNRIVDYNNQNECLDINSKSNVIEQIKIKYLTDGTKPLEYIDGKSDWVDLRASETVTLKAGEFKLIPLGVAMELPTGYEAHIVPRSSTFKNYGIIQTNSCGIVDESYCGDEDQWMMPVYATQSTTINKNDRICQFRIYKHQPQIKFKTVNNLSLKNRGGFGSTGVK